MGDEPVRVQLPLLALFKMKRMKSLFLIILSICILGCSTPGVDTYRQIYSITKREEKKKVPMGGRRKVVTITDFRLNDAYDEDIDALKEKVEKYILTHPETADSIKLSLREFKVSAGLNREQVELLLGKPDKIITASGKDNYGSTEIWVYRINKTRIVTVFIIPVLPVKESYRFVFKGDNLAGIERHYLKQIVKESPASGLFGPQDQIGTKK